MDLNIVLRRFYINKKKRIFSLAICDWEICKSKNLY